MSFFFLIILMLFLRGNLLYQKKSKILRNLNELSDDIVIMNINDVHCGINNTIGYDGYLLYYEELKTIYKNVIKVDVGDNIQGGVIGSISSGSAIIIVK